MAETRQVDRLRTWANSLNMEYDWVQMFNWYKLPREVELMKRLNLQSIQSFFGKDESGGFRSRSQQQRDDFHSIRL